MAGVLPRTGADAPASPPDHDPGTGAQADTVHGGPMPDRPVRGAVSGTARTRAVVLLFPVLIGAVAGFSGASLWSPVYASRAQLLYEISQEKSTGFLREDRSLTTQQVLLRSRQVLGPVAAREGIPVEELEEQVTISLVDSSEVLQVEARAGSREAAARRAQAIVDRYLQVAATNRRSGAVDYVRGQLADVRMELAEARAAAPAPAGAPPETSAVGTLMHHLAERERQLLAQLEDLSVVQLEQPRPQVIVPPYAVPDPVEPRPLFAAVAGALTGAVIASCALAVMVHRRTREPSR